MKANEAPEKIYCGNNGHGNLSYSNQISPNAIEYCRNDAFIEKALSWLKNHYRDYMNHKELKRALKYCDAINKDLQSVKLKNTPKAIEIRNEIIPNAVEWFNTHMQTVCLYVKDDKCYLV